jgi:hypothetical protein
LKGRAKFIGPLRGQLHNRGLAIRMPDDLRHRNVGFALS